MMVITVVSENAKTNTETEEIIGFVVIIFIIGGISIGESTHPPGCASDADRVQKACFSKMLK